MSRSTRIIEIVQLLRAADKPVTAAALAQTLEVSKRTIYRDIAALQGMRAPVEGEAGVGYVLRGGGGFELPPLMFDIEELEALCVALALLARTGDAGFMAAAARVEAKIDAVLPADLGRLRRGSLVASAWGATPGEGVSTAALRSAVRDSARLRIRYRDEAGAETERVIAPVAMFYHIKAVMVVAWCGLRGDFRHFRADRIQEAMTTGEHFRESAPAMLEQWRASEAAP